MRWKVSERMTLKDVLTGFPLPLYVVERTSDRELWKALVGTRARVKLQEVIPYILRKVPIISLQGSPALRLMEGVLRSAIKHSAAGTQLNNALVGAAMLHRVVLGMMVKSTVAFTIKYAMPFLKAAGLNDNTRWPLNFEINEASLGDASTYRVLDAYANGVICGDGEPDFAPCKAILTPSAHLLFQTRQEANKSDCLWNILEELNKIPKTVFPLYSEGVGNLRCFLIIMLSTRAAECVQHLFEEYGKADVIVVYPGRYTRSNRKRSSGIDNSTFVTKAVECQRYMLGANVGRSTETVKVLESHPRSVKESATPASGDVLQVPAGVRVVILNPHTTTTIWRQVMHVDIKEIASD